MNLSSFSNCITEVFTETVDVAGLFHSNHLALFCKRREITAPDDIIYCYFSTEKNFFARFEVNHTDQVRSVEAEEISEVAILMIAVSIVRIIERSLVVSREESYTFET